MMVSRKVKISNDMVYNGEEEQKCPVEYMEVEKIAESYGMPIAKVFLWFLVCSRSCTNVSQLCFLDMYFCIWRNRKCW